MLFDITSQLLFSARERADARMGFLTVVRPGGTNIAFLNATDESSGTNPAWVRLNADEEYPLEAESACGSAETFITHRVVGNIVGQNAIAQEVSKRTGLS